MRPSVDCTIGGNIQNGDLRLGEARLKSNQDDIRVPLLFADTFVASPRVQQYWQPSGTLWAVKLFVLVNILYIICCLSTRTLPQWMTTCVLSYDTAHVDKMIQPL